MRVPVLYELTASGWRGLSTQSSAGKHIKNEADKDFKPVVNLSNTMKLYETRSELFEPSQRPIAIIFSWLNAKESNVAKYRTVYNSYGMDMLHVRTLASNVVFDRKLMDTVEGVLDLLNQSANQHRPIIMHGFSVGAYLYCHSAVHILAHPEKYEGIRSRLKGIVMDSPVDFDCAARGLSRTLTRTPWLQESLERFFNLQFRTTLSFTMRRFLEMSAVFRDNPLRLPAVVFNSHRDKIASHEQVNKAMEQWRAHGLPVTDKWWTDSLHAAHFRLHPEEYKALVHTFCRQIGIVPRHNQGQGQEVVAHEEEGRHVALQNDNRSAEEEEPVRQRVAASMRAN